MHSHRGGILKSISDDQKNQPTFDQPTTRLPCPRCRGSLLLPPRGARLVSLSNFGTLFADEPKHVGVYFLPTKWLHPSSFFGRPPTANTVERESPIYLKSLSQLFPRLHGTPMTVTYVRFEIVLDKVMLRSFNDIITTCCRERYFKNVIYNRKYIRGILE